MNVTTTVPRGMLIDGRWCDGEATFPVLDPATGGVIAEVADATAADGLAALGAAVDRQATWAMSSPQARADVLRAAHDRLVARVEELAELMTLEMGKSLAESRGEVLYGAQFLRWFAEEAVRIDGGWTMAPDGRSRIVTMRQPVGPCLLIVAWNFPLALAARKVAAAISAGCTMVLKPSELTPLSSLAFAEILREAGLPDGVLNVVATTSAAEVCAPLLTDRRLRKLSFTGSTAVGRRLAAQAGSGMLRVSMELGGNAPFIVLADADLDAAAEGAALAKLRNIGQACTAANRFLVAEPVAEEFTARLCERMSSLRLGPGLDPATDIGPMIDTRQRDKVAQLVQTAVERGAGIRLGGRAPAGVGAFYEPTVLSDVDFGSPILAEEIFGPVAPIVTVTDETEALAIANATEHGLVAYLYTTDLDAAMRVSERLDFGMVAVNRGHVSNAAAPFGGIKASGLGREGGHEGLDAYVETKYLSLAVPATAPVTDNTGG